MNPPAGAGNRRRWFSGSSADDNSAGKIGESLQTKKDLDPMMTPASAVRALVRGLLLSEGYIPRTSMHLQIQGNSRRRLGYRCEATDNHLDLKRANGGSKGGGAIGSGINGGADAKSSRMLARQHASIADGHATAARNSRAPDVISAHRDAEDLHRATSGHYHVAADAYKRGASREAEQHLDRAQAHARVAHTASRNVNVSRL
jgi:hypothetical protein